MNIRYLTGEMNPENTTEYAVCLGVFDGVHIGHRALISKTVERAEEAGVKSAVAAFFSPKAKNRIYLLEQQAELIEKMGVDTLFVILLDEKLRKLSPEEFIKSYVSDYLKAVHVVCGYDYTFGFQRSGNAATIAEFSTKYNYEFDIIDKVTLMGERVSSTAVRALIAEGNIKKANLMLGADFEICGCVVEGFKLGRTIGYPTANLKLCEELSEIKRGVYSTVSVIDGKEYKSITNIGVAPTADNNKSPLSETYIPDFGRNIYNKYIKIIFRDFLREEKKFENIDELTKEIAENVRMLVNR